MRSSGYFYVYKSSFGPRSMEQFELNTPVIDGLAAVGVPFCQRDRRLPDVDPLLLKRFIH